MAILHGLSPASVERCRVLEIACSDGANLIPMAYAIPSSEFVGFDLAGLPIERGQAKIRELGLRNVRLFQGDLLEAGAELGPFDFIIAHGLYAWVPEPVRDRLLALCGELLTAEGVAFISYNAMPGGHLRTMIREIMLSCTSGMEDPLERVQAGLGFLRFLIQSRPEGDLLRALLENQLARMEQRDAAGTRHDELTDAYQPVYFADFAGHAQRHGLQYLSEAELAPPTDPGYRTEIQAALEDAACGDSLRKEQLLDFVRMRAYRETLLCRAGRRVEHSFSAEHFRRLLFASQATATPGESPGTTVFVLPGGIRMESNHPVVAALLKRLAAAWPRALRYDEITPDLAEAGFTLDAGGAALLIRLAVTKMIELHAWSAPVARGVVERPRVSAYCRQEARAQQRNATSLLHKTVSLEDARVRSLLRLLDGTRDRGAILEAMKAEFPDTPAVELESGIEPGLMLFHRTGVLEA
jgi:methyltransferase-like protein